MDRNVNEWDLVVKITEQSLGPGRSVKYGDTLRRFSAYVNGTSMDHNMKDLRAKIIDLFKLSPEVDIILTYTDVDGDLVTLVDDDELRDAVIYQHLNPLRINVQLNGNPPNNVNTKPQSKNSSEFGKLHSSSVNFAVSEALKSVPEPIGSALSKLSQDLVSKAAASAPAITEIVEHLTKLGLSHALSVGTTTHQGDLNVNSGETPGDLLSGPNVCASAMPVDYTPKNKEMQPETAGNAEHHKEDVGQCFRESVSNTTQLPVSLIDQEQNLGVNKHPASTTCAPGIAIPASDQFKSKCPGITAAMPDINWNTENSSGTNRHLGATAAPVVSGSSFRRAGFPCRRSYSHHDNPPRVFHRGVQCDSCGMHPIMGPRYKSNVKENYDLCSICFAQMGNEADYTRMDRPPCQRSRESFCRFQNSAYHGFRGHGMGRSRAKLESRFIQDVTIMDGTLMPPSAPFTKIWKMHNNGSTPWPVGTQLIWIGGDNFADTTAVELEIPMNGFPAGEEIDIAVDFVAPASLGRYMSYWRLCSPSGQKFGQRVWVLIQVDADSYASGYYHTELNLNLPPVSTGWNGTSIIDINVQPTEDFCGSEPDLSGAKVESMKLPACPGPDKGFQSVPVDDPDLANNGFAQAVPEVIALASFPTGDSSSFPSNATREMVPIASYPNVSSFSASPIAPQLVTPLASYPSHETVEVTRGTGFQSVTLDDPDMANNGFTQVPEVIPLTYFPTGDSSSVPSNATRGNVPMTSYPNLSSFSASPIAPPLVTPLASYPLHETVEVTRGTGSIMIENRNDYINDSSPLSTNSVRGKTPMVSYPIIGSSLDSTITTPKIAPLSSYPSIDLPPPSVTAPMISPLISVDPPPRDTSDDTAMQAEKALLKELDEMGFKQVDLNKEILRMNEYDLERSLDDLCGGVDEWDPLLEELQEMGFHDKETNKKLLVKNGGSIKRVVLDLIAGEKAK